MKSMKYFNWLILILTLILIGVLYLFTAAPAMLWLDSARLVAAMQTLGIPNPPGFPLFILLGNLFTKIPYGTIIFRVQILTLVTSLATLFLVYKITRDLIDDGSNSFLPGMFALFSLAFTYQFWTQSTYIETFILVSFFTALTLHIALKQINSRREYVFRVGLLALIMGLAVGTNPIVISVMPALGIFVLRGAGNLSLSRIFKFAAIGIFTALLIYGYIPIRAREYPFLNWHTATDISSFWKQTTGGALNVYAPDLNRINGFTGSGKVFIASTVNYFNMMIKNFPIYMLPFVAAGIIKIYQTRQFAFWLLSLTVLSNIILSGLYKSGNQENWFLVSYVVFSVYSGVGYLTLGRLLSGIRDGQKIASIGIIISLISLFVNFSSANRRGWYITDDYVNNLYKGVESPALIFGSGDFYDAHAYFAHDVAKPKPDVIPVTDNNLYIEDWYRNNLVKSTDLVLPDKSKYKFDSAKDYSEYVNDFFEVNLNKGKKVYVTQVALRNRLFPGLTGKGSLKINLEKFKLVPSGMLMQVVPIAVDVEPRADTFEFQFKSAGFPGKRPFFVENSYQKELNGMINEYAFSYAAIGEYYSAREKKEEATKYLKMASEFNPGNPEITENYKKIQAGEKLDEATASAVEKITPPTGFAEYQNTRLNLSFLLPVNWWAEERDGTIFVNSDDPNFRLELQLTYKNQDTTEYDHYVNYSQGPGGNIENSGPAKIPGYEDKSYVKVWAKAPDATTQSIKKQPVQHLQFFLFGKENKVVQVIVGPSVHKNMKKFDTLVSSVRF